MKNLFFAALIAVAAVSSLSSCGSKVDSSAKSNLIQTVVPERAQGQTDVLELRTDPMDTVRIAVIGLGMRGGDAAQRLTKVPGTKIVALCDVYQDKVTQANEWRKANGLPAAKEYYGDTAAWRKAVAQEDVDLVYVVTAWDSHAEIGVEAMKNGKHVAIEVPAAMSMDEIWALVNTSEQTRKHCMQLENCVYDFFELTSLNMAQQGLFGEILHAEGSYIHSLEPFWNSYTDNWRLKWNQSHRGDIYPTHGLGPAAQALNIHRGDKMNYLVSMDTKVVSIPKFIEKTTGKDVSKDFKNGDHTTTMIRTENGKTIEIQHNVATPRPYSRMYQLTGTKGFANKYPSEGYALGMDELGDAAGKYDDLNAHSYIPEEVKKSLMEKYKHPIHKELEARAKEVGGHGGMDYIMDYRLIYCLRNGLPLDMDVYDLAEWCCLTELSGLSIENNSAPVAIPDFTRGSWNKLTALKFY
ncbi:MAG: Gfo/Idh/MocA family oxidoreductase [Mucinivorans sp.]